MMPIDDNVVGPRHSCDAIRAKADGLVEADPRIEQGDWHNQRVDEWGCQKIEDAALAEEPRNTLLQLPMREADLVLEANATCLNPIAPLLSGAVEFSLELALQSGDMCEKIIDTRRHEGSVARRNRCRETVGSVSMTANGSSLVGHPVGVSSRLLRKKTLERASPCSVRSAHWAFQAVVVNRAVALVWQLNRWWTPSSLGMTQGLQMKNPRQFLLPLSLITLSLVPAPAHGQERGDASTATQAKKRTETTAKQREDEAARRKADESKTEEPTAKRRDEEAKEREEPAKRRDTERRRSSAEHRRSANPPKPARVVFVGGYFYDPIFGPFPWWPPAVYPYRWARFDGRAQVRVMASPKHAAVYVDGFYAGIVDDFDGFLQPLPLLPGGHTIALFLDGYHTVNRSVYLTPGSTLKLRETLERLPPGMASAPPAVAPVLPPPPPGTYIDVRTPPCEQPVSPGRHPEEPTIGFGVLALRIQPTNAVVTIDGQQWLSTTPGHIVIHLSAGRHVVTVGMPERPPFSTEVDVRDGETTELNVNVAPRTTD